MDVPRWRIGEMASRTGLSARTLRYYEELGLVTASGRLAGGHRVYTSGDLVRLYRICLLRTLGIGLGDIRRELDSTGADGAVASTGGARGVGGADVGGLTSTLDRHVAELDRRIGELGRQRERVARVRGSLTSGSPSDVQLLEVLRDVAGEQAQGPIRRVTLLVYAEIEAVFEYLVSVFGLGPGQISRDERGRVVHAEVHAGDGVVWLHPPSAQYRLASPAELGAGTACMAVMVEDVDAHHIRTVAAGAEVEYAPQDMPYGVREYAARDPEGGLWSFMTTLETDGIADAPTDL